MEGGRLLRPSGETMTRIILYEGDELSRLATDLSMDMETAVYECCKHIEARVDIKDRPEIFWSAVVFMVYRLFPDHLDELIADLRQAKLDSEEHAGKP